MKDLISRHAESPTRSEMVRIIQRDLPGRPLNDIRLLYAGYFSRLRSNLSPKSQMARLREP
ncbi:hypothetical protein IWW37_005926, partial [Coemansia sp. RSA 2050]